MRLASYVPGKLIPLPLSGSIPELPHVAKVFWGDERIRAADAFCARRREGPYRFIQNQSRNFVAALKSDAAAEKSKDQLSQDFWGCSIFDFCNSIGTFETSRRTVTMSVYRGRPEVIGTRPN
jgi:hypothetical protein